jgi:hypothetical protein
LGGYYIDKEIENRILGVAVVAGSWTAAYDYLLETGKFSNRGAYTAVRMVEKQNAEIKLPWGWTVRYWKWTKS